MPIAEITVSKEDYLKAIIEAESEGHTVIPAFLAQWLGVSAPAVTKALRRLREDGYVSATDGPLKLTTKGREAAHRTALRHHLVERMLSEIFGMEWHQIHAEAERLEHVISPAFEAKLIERLGEAGDCPHGNRVLPETPAQLKRRGLQRLSDAAAGSPVIVSSLYERDARLLEFLHTLGIGPGVTLTPVSRNYDDTLRVRIGSRELTLGFFAADRIWVRPPSSKPRQSSS
ncbi:MAG TPA: metal-dependent transcriptional regulator [Acidobacteriaceae bacterium]|nr:metal-dependent transcriptional regulator [Acidobacteriaceae bacterium]